jgi:multidrug resistance protein
MVGVARNRRPKKPYQLVSNLTQLARRRLVILWHLGRRRLNGRTFSFFQSSVSWCRLLLYVVLTPTYITRPLVSSMPAPAVQLIMDEFNTTSPTFATFSVSIFVLGFASGPLILAPLSELYGRVVIYNVTNVLFLLFTMLCAISRNESMFLTFRFLSGFTGVATITIGSGTIADLMPREKRGKAVSIWSVGTILGPMVGPIIGGYVAEVAGWQWIFWAISIVVSWYKRSYHSSAVANWN